MTTLKKNKDLPRNKRPAIKVLEGSLSALTDVELLGTFIGSGIKGANAKEIARTLLDKYGSKLLTINPRELTSVKGIGSVKAAKLSALFELVCRLAAGLGAEEIDKRVMYVREAGQQQTLFSLLLKADLLKKNKTGPTFIDLFAGIGGIRTAFENAGGRCVFSCEWDKYAQKTYESNFDEIPFGDIKQLTRLSDHDLNAIIPDHDILTAGFPCQPFSLAGVSKKNSLGRKHGFEDPTQGTLFFDIKRILSVKRPRAFMLENVKNLLHHDSGRTWEVIRAALEDELKYVINWGIVDAANWVPQHRERIFIVGYDPSQIRISREEIVIPARPPSNYSRVELADILEKNPDPRHTLGLGTWDTLVRHRQHHENAGNGFGYGLHAVPVKQGETTRTLSARYHKDGAEILIEQPGRRPRKLTVKEAALLMGFPKGYKFAVSDTQAYRQLGNAVVVPAVEATAREVIKVFQKF